MFRPSSRVRNALVALTLVHLTCSGGGPTSPRNAPDAVPTESTPTSAVAQNLPPNPVLRTTPRADPATLPFPTISGDAPLSVRFNLCRSDDPDEGDSLNFQFNFGDSDRPPVNPDGTFNADVDHFCRAEHVYERPGTYTATVSVTDKRLEDQGREVAAFARRTQSLTIVVVSPLPPTPRPEGPPGPGPTPDPTPLPQPRLVITIVANNGRMSYSPDPADARVGQRVVWINAHSMVHTATADGGSFDTGFLNPGATSAAITIPAAGTFPYHCLVHPGMLGTLRVTP